MYYMYTCKYHVFVRYENKKRNLHVKYERMFNESEKKRGKY